MRYLPTERFEIYTDNGETLFSKNCDTWEKYLDLCYDTAQELPEDTCYGKAPCYGCPCCNWSSGTQDWSDAEYALRNHTCGKSWAEAQPE